MKRPVFELFIAGETERQDKKDCQVRALSTARGIDYTDAWELLYKIQGEMRHCGFTLVESLNKGDTRLGMLRKMPMKAVKGKPRMTGERFCREYPKGRFILQMAHHMAAVVDGKLFDSWNSTQKCVYTAWEVEVETAVDRSDPQLV